MKYILITLILLSFKANAQKKDTSQFEIVNPTWDIKMYTTKHITISFSDAINSVDFNLDDSAMSIEGDSAKALYFAIKCIDSIFKRERAMTEWLREGFITHQIQFFRRPQFEYKRINYKQP